MSGSLQSNEVRNVLFPQLGERRAIRRNKTCNLAHSSSTIKRSWALIREERTGAFDKSQNPIVRRPNDFHTRFPSAEVIDKNGRGLKRELRMEFKEATVLVRAGV